MKPGPEVGSPSVQTPWAWPTRLLATIAGYIVAVAVATAVTVVVMLAPSALPDGGARGSLVGTLAEVMPVAMIVGFFWTFLCALPGFVVAVIIGEMRRWNGWIAYALAGLANVVPALAIYSGLAGSPFAIPLMVAGSFPGGFAGGAAYWMAVGFAIAARRPAA